MVKTRILSLIIWLNVLVVSGAENTRGDEALLSKLQSLEQRVDTELHALQSEVKELKAQINHIETQNQARDNFIGFTAYNNVDLFVSEGETVVYNTVQTNAGGGYDTGTGVFTCPVTGLYFFGTATYSAGTIVDIQLMKENTGLMGSFADQNNADQGSNFWVVECLEGERVWTIQVNNGGIIEVGMHAGSILHSFVGFLVSL